MLVNTIFSQAFFRQVLQIRMLGKGLSAVHHASKFSFLFINQDMLRFRKCTPGSNLNGNENGRGSVSNKRFLSIEGFVKYCVRGAWK